MAERFTSRTLGDELIIHDAVTDSVHVLSKTARIVYELTREGKTAEQVVVALRQSFAVPQENDLGREVAQCLEELRAKELVD